ncbi:MAG TPA: PAS domain S-box protein [Prolixibacteraceae bacterium]|jgi:PAS domain S-box-containing protein
MIDQNKTKAQLVRELQELRLENSLQKGIYDHAISSGKQAEASLQLSEERFRSIFNNLQDAFFQADMAGNLTLVSPSAVCMYGFDSVDEMIGRSATNLYADEQSRFQLLQELKTNGSLQDFVVQGKKKDGSLFWVSMNAQFRVHNGQLVGTEGIVRDISERKMAAEKVKESEERLQDIFNNLQDGYFEVDLNGIFTTLSPSAIRLYDINATEELKEFSTSNIYADPRDREELLSLLAARQRVEDFVCQGKRKDQSTFWVSISAQYKYNTKAQPIGVVGIVRDISKRHQAEVSLVESEARFREVLENSMDASYKRNLVSNVYDYLSPVFYHIAGYTQEEMNNLSMEAVLEMLHPDDLSRINSVIVEALASPPGLAFQFEYRFKHKTDGQYRWLNDKFTVMRNDQGLPLALIGSVSDITESKRAEVALSESEARFKTIFMEAPIGIVVTDSILGELRQVNARFAEIVGRSIEELTGIQWMAITHPDDIQPNQAKMQGLLSGKCSSFDMQKRYLKPDGTVVWVKMTIIPLNIYPNNHPHNLCMIEDITDKIQNELELIVSRQKVEQSEYRLKLATASAGLGIWDWDVLSNEQVWDDKMFEFYGIDQNTFAQIEDPWAHGMHPEDQQRAIDECNAALRGEADYNTSFRVLQPDGTVLHIKADGSVIRDSEGRPLRMIGINRDITEARLAEEQLIRAKEQAEESDRLKSAFLANMSHEIRTPINSIVGFSELLNDPEFGQEQKDEFTKIIVENGNNLLLLINDLMDLSMLEARQMKIKKTPFELRKLLSDLEDEFKIKARSLGIEFHVNIPPGDENRMIVNDLYRIRQIFCNLIGNALKFTSKGAIEIGFFPINQAVSFYVKDTGIGIAAEFHQDIFLRFRQVDETKTRKYGGNGLGLSICKNIVETMGGEIDLESEQGKGSLFVFTLPIH